MGVYSGRAWLVSRLMETQGRDFGGPTCFQSASFNFSFAGGSRTHNIQPPLEPVRAGRGGRKGSGGPSVLFCEYSTGKRIMGLKGTEGAGEMAQR